MWDKQGVVHKPLVNIPSIILLGIALLFFAGYFFTCAALGKVGVCGGRAADITIDTATFVGASRLRAILETPVAVEPNARVKDLTFGELLVQTHEVVRTGGDAQHPVVRAYQREAQFLMQQVRPVRLDGKVRSTWNLKVVEMPGNTEVKLLTVKPSLDAFFSEDYAQQKLVIPMQGAKGALQVELFLSCSGCKAEDVGAFV